VIRGRLMRLVTVIGIACVVVLIVLAVRGYLRPIPRDTNDFERTLAACRIVESLSDDSLKLYPHATSVLFYVAGMQGQVHDTARILTSAAQRARDGGPGVPDSYVENLRAACRDFRAGEDK